MEAEGGCGVIGVASAEKIAGKHLLAPLQQMRNRGNGKGGGIAAVGLSPEAFGISQELLENDYLIAIHYIDHRCRAELEKRFAQFTVDHVFEMAPDVVIYFVQATDEAIYKNSNEINRTFYAATGEKRAFVLSHGKNLLVLKMVGYGDDVIRKYQLEEFLAHVWIGHHRYPTKGTVWHPGGAHPFVGLHEALVHNGDFANYFSLCEYLAERKIYPHFLTDTEVAVLLFDLLHRSYNYPLEHVIEAFAPTTERDFTLLTKDKQETYRKLQQLHMQGSPDGPWFFLIAQSTHKEHRLLGITDTSMLRPQVFAAREGIGFAASEKQAIDAMLKSMSLPEADHYWNARGGSATDGGAFIFSVSKSTLTITNKFGEPVPLKKRPKAPTPPISDAHLIDAKNFSPEGENSLAREIVRLYQQGIKQFSLINCAGHRFIGCGLGPNSDGVRIEVQGSSGDYLASGIDGAEIIVYGDGQDQLAQIMKAGTLVIHGDVGQTFLYGAKGGTIFVRGSAAGRPLINAVGKPRVIINGTCLDYLAESFMAGDPLQGGGFVLLNGLHPDGSDMETPYPGSNLFSLPSGGAIYLRDPQNKVDDGQLNGGEFVPMTAADWELLLPYLNKNERLFGITLSRLLNLQSFSQVYRKIAPKRVRALHEEEAWVKNK